MCYWIIFLNVILFLKLQKKLFCHALTAKLIAGLENENFSDFEDCLQMECAKSYKADYIVTRNVSDYETSEVKAIMPKDYVSL